MSIEMTITVSLQADASMLHWKDHNEAQRSSLKNKLFGLVGYPKNSDFCFVKKRVVD